MGVAAAYATIALRAAGGASERGVRWYVDGRETSALRLRLIPGRHVIRARTAAGEEDEVTIEVEP